MSSNFCLKILVLLTVAVLLSSHPTYARRTKDTYQPRFQPLIDQYMVKIGEMQQLVRDNVRDIELRLTEADGSAEWNHLFGNEGIRSIVGGLDYWGIHAGGEFSMDRLRLYSIGHMWITVESARFRSDIGTVRAQEILAKMNGIQQELSRLHRALRDESEKIKKEYRKMMFFGISEDLKQTYNEAREYDKMLALHKGMISESFTASLIYQLRKSLKERTGD